MKSHLRGLDFETTDLDPLSGGEIVSIGMAIRIDKHRMEHFHQLVLPTENAYLHPKAIEVNGYSREEWIRCGAIPIGEAMTSVIEWLDLYTPLVGPRYTTVAHNAGFEEKWLAWAERTSGKPLNQYIPPTRPRLSCSQRSMQAMMDAGLVHQGSVSLDSTIERVGLKRESEFHNSGEDAGLCLQCYEWILKKMNPRSAWTLLKRLFNFA